MLLYIEDTSDDWEREQKNLLGAYWERLNSGDPSVRNAAASAFVGYELSISKTYIDSAFIEECLQTPSLLIPFAVMEVQYMRNNGFMHRGQLLDNVDKISHLKIAICHGRADYVCQPQAAWRLYKALQKEGCNDVNLEFVAGAGHSGRSSACVFAILVN